MQEDLRNKLLGKQDLYAEKLPEMYEGAFLGWSMYQKHHYLPSPVYDLDKMWLLSMGFEDEVEFIKYIYATYVEGKGDKSFSPIFLSKSTVITKEFLN